MPSCGWQISGMSAQRQPSRSPLNTQNRD
jgi:hypothetical protein